MSLGLLDDWEVTVTVERFTKDARGNRTLVSTHEVDRCLIGRQSSTEEPASRSDLPETTTDLFTSVIDADLQSGDVVTVPAGHGMPHGRFLVEGDPGFTPMGTSAGMRRVQ